jgi:hypothetical protein
LAGRFSGDNVDGTTNIMPKMGLDRLLEGYRSIMAHIYSPSFFYQRVKSLLREFGVPHARTPMDFHRVLAFLHSCYRLGNLGRERFQYWHLLLWTMTHRPRLLSLALTLAVYGHHFRKICELHILRDGH